MPHPLVNLSQKYKERMKRREKEGKKEFVIKLSEIQTFSSSPYIWGVNCNSVTKTNSDLRRSAAGDRSPGTGSL
jgi:hypothetical protein